jgi:hypothetical protein
MGRKFLIAALAAVGALAVPSAAFADTTSDSLVTGETLGSIAVAAPAASVGTLSPGSTPGVGTGQSTPSAVAVVATSPWYLRVTDGNSGGAHQGHMLQDNTGGLCTGSAAFLANPLHLTQPTVITGTVDAGSSGVDLSSANSLLAHGTLTDTVTLSYRQSVNANELLKALCPYQLTATYTVAAR